MRAYKIHFIRHGLTAGNLAGCYMGSTDCDLCPQGVTELQSLLAKYDYPAVGKIYTSPMKRCIQTANILYPDRTLTPIDDLRECNFGDFEGKSIVELKDDPAYVAWIGSNMQTSPPNGEGAFAFAKRIFMGLDQIIADMTASHISEVAVVVHGGVLMTLLTKIATPQRKPAEWAVGNGKGYTLRFNAALWHNSGLMELVEPLPFDCAPGVTAGNALFEGK